MAGREPTTGHGRKASNGGRYARRHPAGEPSRPGPGDRRWTTRAPHAPARAVLPAGGSRAQDDRSEGGHPYQGHRRRGRHGRLPRPGHRARTRCHRAADHPVPLLRGPAQLGGHRTYQPGRATGRTARQPPRHLPAGQGSPRRSRPRFRPPPCPARPTPADDSRGVRADRPPPHGVRLPVHPRRTRPSGPAPFGLRLETLAVPRRQPGRPGRRSPADRLAGDGRGDRPGTRPQHAAPAPDALPPRRTAPAAEQGGAHLRRRAADRRPARPDPPRPRGTRHVGRPRPRDLARADGPARLRAPRSHRTSPTRRGPRPT